MSKIGIIGAMDEEVEILIDMAFKGYKDEEIAEELGRSKKMVVYKK